MLTDSLDYALPPHLIATEPVQPRDAARLMVIDRRQGSVEHHRVSDLPDLARNDAAAVDGPQRGDLMVFNQSRVIAASFAGQRRNTGGRVRGLYLDSPNPHNGDDWLVMLEARGKLREDELIDLDDESTLQLTQRQSDGRWLAKLASPHDTHKLLERIGQPPLPPYIRHQRRQRHQPEAQASDKDRYNTVFAQEPGSVAAPTAGLHFTGGLLEQLSQKGVRTATITLHVGLGTFAPVRTPRIEDHAIHSEKMTVPAATLAAIAETHRNAKRVIPVGTTTVRALESLPDPPPASGDFTTHTGLLIAPSTHGEANDPGAATGFSFRYTDALMTNFHLPRSTLLAMVSALPGVGIERLLGWYRLAIEQGYRFYSYGDAMLIL